MTKRVDYYDTLRVTAMVGVVSIHLASPVVNMAFSSKGLSSSWIQGDVMMAMTRFAVPVFFMLTGATMMHRRYDWGDFFSKRFSRVFVPFIFATLGYITFRLNMNTPKPNVETWGELWHWTAGQYVDCGLSRHLWYVYALLAVYPLIPLVERILRTSEGTKARTGLTDGLIIAWLIYITLTHSPHLSPITLPTMPQLTTENLMSSTGAIFIGRKVLTYVMYLGYVLLGYRLSVILNEAGRQKVTNYTTRTIALLIYTATVAYCSMSCYINSNGGRLYTGSQGYLHINTAIQAIAVFAMTAGTDISKWSSKVGNITMRLRDSLSECSYGIYLYHIMVISTLWAHKIYWKIAEPWISVPLLTLGCTIATWVIVATIRRWKYGRYVVG